MDSGWIVQIEVEAGKGELEPLLYAVALPDHRDAMAAAREAPVVVETRVVLGGRAPPIHRCLLVVPLRSETVGRVGLARGAVWRL